MSDGMNRRRFLKVLGVTTGGAAAVSACGADEPAKLIPYLVAPEEQVPGVATYYASTCRECPAGCGLHVKVREGRAIKLEGNPDSPVNRGRLCAMGQAALQGLYNPDRLTSPMARRADGTFEAITWDDAIGRLAQGLSQARSRAGAVVFVTGQESGSFGALVDEWVRQLNGRRLPFEPFAYEALRDGNRIAFGTSAIPAYDFGAARFVLSFGADFQET
ncbi:MAG: molybdopterin-dependent oxidoreductase, partial [Gemmatimonadales bacterium]